jgi:peptidoglycan L-alanyl-D-glutamate endopeptidase CwlK
MPYHFSHRSLAHLSEVHPDLQKLFHAAITTSPLDFAITEGRRSRDRQKHLCAIGASRTMQSRHLTGHAIDIVPWVAGQARWDWPLFHILADHILYTADTLQIPVEWGGHWVTFPDGPHFQLPATLQ